MATDPSPQPNPTSTISESPAFGLARRRRAALSRHMHLLEEALAGAAADPAWRRRVGARLGRLRTSFAAHVVATEGPDGLYTDLLDQEPRLARGVHVLIREHGAIVAAMSALQRRADFPETTAEQLRGWSGELLRAMSRHRQRDADLLYEAYRMDIAGEA
ncbi:hypothetical protein AB0J86_06670 [Micromonospora sp. NPDC049559]|uniref:hypothetical protein n=1 Tax=Micromonospora sp. NPDC049559 TaxID=3155923 RepID=UPI00343EB073